MGRTTSFISKLLFREIREIVAPISKQGIEPSEIRSKGWEGHVSAEEFVDGSRPEPFTPSTVIINGGYAIWELELPEHIRNSLVDLTLKVETVRTHGMLHTPHAGKSAIIFVNGQLVDRIYLVKPHPHGEDFGVDSRRPFPILRYVKKDGERQTARWIQIRIETEEEVFWDIDRITLEPIVLRKEIKPEAAMILGALISAALGGVVSYLMLRVPVSR